MAGEVRTIINAKATIAVGQTASNVCGGAEGMDVYGVIFPASGFTGTKVNFQVSRDGTTWVPVNFSPGDGTSTAVSLPKVAPGFVVLDAKIRGAQRLQLVSDAAQTGSAVDLYVVCGSSI